MSSHNLITTVKKLATIETLVDGVMLTFAVASVGNVSTYMATNGHNPLTSYTVGAALGLGLVAVSVMLARVDMEDKRTFASMLASTVALGLLSGAVQCLAYLEHVSNPWVAGLMGFGFPLCGEALLALSMAFYTQAQRRRRTRQADDGMEERINEAITDALTNIDITGMQSYIEKQAAVILRHKMGEIVARRIGGTVKPVADEPQPTGPGMAESRHIAELQPMANEARQRIVDDRQEAIAQLFSLYGSMGMADLLQRLQDDRGIDASERTLRGDLQAMEADGRLTKPGRGRWDVCLDKLDNRLMSLSNQPTMTEPVLNGQSH